MVRKIIFNPNNMATLIESFVLASKKNIAPGGKNGQTLTLRVSFKLSPTPMVCR